MKDWGLCIGYEEPIHKTKIRLSNDFFCSQWLTMILAHEMAHQWQWDVHGPERRLHKRVPLLSHGPSFYEFKANMKSYGIPLKVYYSIEKWFKYQDIMKV